MTDAEKKYREMKFNEKFKENERSSDTSKRGFASKNKQGQEDLTKEQEDKAQSLLKDEGKSGNYPKQASTDQDLTNKRELGGSLDKEEIDKRLERFD